MRRAGSMGGCCCRTRSSSCRESDRASARPTPGRSPGRARPWCSPPATPSTSPRCRRRSRTPAAGRSRVPTNLVDAEQVTALVDRHDRRATGASTGSSTTRSAWTRSSRSTRSISRKWRKIFEVNVWGALGLTQACLPHLKKAAAEHGDASVVFIISMSMRNIRAARGRLLVVEGRGPDRGEDDGGRARPDRRARELRRARVGSAARTSRRSSAGSPSRAASRRDDVRAEIEARIPLRHHPAAGRDREQRRVLRVAVVAGRHRSDPRRQRR